MELSILHAGLGLSFGGAVVLALADAWLTRSMLAYLDAVEANVTKMVEALRAGSTYVIVTSMDVKRDQSQNVARGLKMIGWLALAAGIGFQLAAAYLTKPPGS
jgi:hypothetical protein